MNTYTKSTQSVYPFKSMSGASGFMANVQWNLTASRAAFGFGIIALDGTGNPLSDNALAAVAFEVGDLIKTQDALWQITVAGTGAGATAIEIGLNTGKTYTATVTDWTELAAAINTVLTDTQYVGGIIYIDGAITQTTSISAVNKHFTFIGNNTSTVRSSWTVNNGTGLKLTDTTIFEFWNLDITDTNINGLIDYTSTDDGGSCQFYSCNVTKTSGSFFFRKQFDGEVSVLCHNSTFTNALTTPLFEMTTPIAEGDYCRFNLQLVGCVSTGYLFRNGQKEAQAVISIVDSEVTNNGSGVWYFDDPGTGNERMEVSYGITSFVDQTLAAASDPVTFTLHTSGAGTLAIVMNDTCSATGARSTAEGTNTWATGQDAHAEGNSQNIPGAGTPGSTALKAEGNNSHAEGFNTYAAGSSSHAEGEDTTASGTKAHAEGNGGKADAWASHVEGIRCWASGSGAHAEGESTQLPGSGTPANDALKAEGLGSHAEGKNTYSEGNYSHAEGDRCRATGTEAHAEGSKTWANGNQSHSEGLSNSPPGSGTPGSTAQKAEGIAAHSEGRDTYAKADYSHAQGFDTESQMIASHSEGKESKTDHDTAHAHGGGKLSGIGDSQYERVVMNQKTTTGADEEFRIDSQSTAIRLTLTDGDSWAFVISVVGRQEGAIAVGVDGDSGMYHFKGLIKRIGASTTIVGAVVKDTPIEDNAGWDCNVTADDVNEALKVAGHGLNGENTVWTATIHITKVAA